MTKRTMTGIAIESCDYCGREHPISRLHCSNDECRSPSIFVTPDAPYCLPCDQLPGQLDLLKEIQQ